MPGYANYLKGSDPRQWLTRVPTFAGVRYAEVYEGIDVAYHGNEGALEYDFIVAPGADPAAIRLAFEGTDRISVDGRGELVIGIAGGELRQRRSVLYQEIGGRRREVDGGYALAGGESGLSWAPTTTRGPWS